MARQTLRDKYLIYAHLIELMAVIAVSVPHVSVTVLVSRARGGRLVKVVHTVVDHGGGGSGRGRVHARCEHTLIDHEQIVQCVLVNVQQQHQTIVPEHQMVGRQGHGRIEVWIIAYLLIEHNVLIAIHTSKNNKQTHNQYGWPRPCSTC